MGRYYAGDIEGKFWVAVQASDDADFFGVTGQQPNELEYYFDKENLLDVKNGIKICKDKLGKNKTKLDKFFKINFAYNDKQLSEYGVDPSLLVWYARLLLGEKIKQSIVKNGQCEFVAEM